MPDNFTHQLPRQRIPRSEKDQDWKEQTVDSIVDLCRFQSPFRREDERDRMIKAYRYYNGEVVDNDYTHVTMPYGNKRENFPAKLRNFPIIKPVIDLLLGEKSRRPSEWTIKVNNDDITNRKLEEKTETLKRNLIEHFLNELSNQGIESDFAPQEEPPSPEEVAERFEDTYRDKRSVQGEKVLNYLEDDLELDRKFIKGFKHFLIAGEVFSSRGVGLPDLEYEILNPLQIDYEKSPDQDFIEDGQWVCHRRLSTVNDVLDAFYEELTDKEVSRLEKPNRDYDPFTIYSDDPYTENDNGRLIEVMEVYWKSMRKIGIVSFRDEFGFFQQREVEEGYTPGPGESVEWYWVTEVWQGYRIDEDIYKRVQPLEVQRGDLDNKSKSKLPINGRRYSDMNSPNVSLAILGIPYQISYNVYKYRLDNAVARSKDIIAQLDINMIPDNWDMDEFMYRVEATGIAWTDYSQGELPPQHQSVLDLSVKVIQDYVGLLQSILQEWERISGVSRQRQGRIFASETKGGSEQAIVQSSYITEPYFNKFSHFEERELSALLDYSKIQWVSGKSLSYVTADGSQEILNIDGIEHMESEYGIRVSNSKEDLENIEQLRELSQAMLQNGASLTEVIDIMDANSIASIKDKIEKAEENRRQLQEAQAKAEQQAAQQEAQIEQAKIEADLEESRMDNETKIRLKEMELQQEDEELESEEEQAEKDREVEREKMSTQEQIARMKANGKQNGSTN